VKRQYGQNDTRQKVLEPLKARFLLFHKWCRYLITYDFYHQNLTFRIDTKNAIHRIRRNFREFGCIFDFQSKYNVPKRFRVNFLLRKDPRGDGRRLDEIVFRNLEVESARLYMIKMK